MTNVVNIYTCLSNYTNPISTQLNVITLYIRLAKLCHEVVSFVCCLDAAAIAAGTAHRQSHWNQERRKRSRKSGFLHKGPSHSGVQFSPDGHIKFNRSETQGFINWTMIQPHCKCLQGIHRVFMYTGLLHRVHNRNALTL